MAFQDRAVAACCQAMREGCVSERHVRDIIKCKSPNVASIEPFLKDKDGINRMMAARIVATHGRQAKVVERAVVEKEPSVLFAMLHALGDVRGEGVEALVSLFESENDMVRDSVIDMFRRSGRSDCLVPLLFDDNEQVVQRVKRYLDETENC